MTFILTQWRIILLASILCITWYYKSAYNDAVDELATFKANIETLKQVKENENKILRDYAKNTVTNLTDTHNNELKGIKNAFIKQNKLDDITIGNLRNELRESIGNSITLPEVADDTERTAEEWRNSYSAIARQYETLVHGCAITTSDYNLLRGWSDAACLQVGCK